MQIADCSLQIVVCRLQITGCRSQFGVCISQRAVCTLQFADIRLKFGAKLKIKVKDKQTDSKVTSSFHELLVVAKIESGTESEIEFESGTES